MRHQRVVQGKAAKGARERKTSTSFFPRQTTHVWDYPILQLQRTIGNQAVQGLIQANLKIGQPGDRYEREAERVADAVMRMPNREASGTLRNSPKIQRMCATCASGQELCPECAEEEEGIQRKPLAATITPLLQRQTVELEKEDEGETLQAKEVAGHAPTVTPDLESHIQALRGGGQALPESVRAFFEPRFGQDFSQVHIHTDVRAAEAARAMNARALTMGRDVLFGEGQHRPDTISGRRLLAHELTHVVQQGATACTASIQNLFSAPSRQVQRKTDPETQRKFDDWYQREKKDLSWVDDLPPCPCPLRVTTILGVKSAENPDTNV